MLFLAQTMTVLVLLIKISLTFVRIPCMSIYQNYIAKNSFHHNTHRLTRRFEYTQNMSADGLGILTYF